MVGEDGGVSLEVGSQEIGCYYKLRLYVMVGFPFHNRHCAVKLLAEDEAREDVGEGHLRQRNLVITSFINTFGKTIRPTNQENQPLRAPHHLLLQKLRECHRRHLLAVLVQQNDEVAAFDFLQEELPLLLLLFLHGQLGILQVRNRLHLKRDVELDLVHVVLHGRAQFRRILLPDIYQLDFHNPVLLTDVPYSDL